MGIEGGGSIKDRIAAFSQNTQIPAAFTTSYKSKVSINNNTIAGSSKSNHFPKSKVSDIAQNSPQVQADKADGLRDNTTTAGVKLDKNNPPKDPVKDGPYSPIPVSSDKASEANSKAARSGTMSLKSKILDKKILDKKVKQEQIAKKSINSDIGGGATAVKSETSNKEEVKASFIQTETASKADKIDSKSVDSVGTIATEAADNPVQILNDFRQDPIREILNVVDYIDTEIPKFGGPSTSYSKEVIYSSNVTIVQLKLIDAFKNKPEVRTQLRELQQNIIPKGFESISTAQNIVKRFIDDSPSELKAHKENGGKRNKKGRIKAFKHHFTAFSVVKNQLINSVKEFLKTADKKTVNDLKEFETGVNGFFQALKDGDGDVLKTNSEYLDYALGIVAEKSIKNDPALTDRILAFANQSLADDVKDGDKIFKAYQDARQALSQIDNSKHKKNFHHEMSVALSQLVNIDPTFAELTPDRTLSLVNEQYAKDLFNPKKAFSQDVFVKGFGLTPDPYRQGNPAHVLLDSTGKIEISSPNKRIEKHKDNYDAAGVSESIAQSLTDASFSKALTQLSIDAETEKRGHFWQIFTNNTILGVGRAVGQARGDFGKLSPKALWVITTSNPSVK